MPVHVIGGGLAGSEAAWQVARAGHHVVLYEMRPVRQTHVHQTDRLAELVCSNSLKSDQGPSASWLLKEELRRLDSLLIRIAARARVPGGHALTVDREIFAGEVTLTIESEPRIELRREEITHIPDNGITIIATGPLTSDALAAEVARFTGSDRLYFYDSISPIIDAGTIDMSIAFRASRYGKSLDGTADYLNCPLDREQYGRFVDALMAAESAESHIPDDTAFFEACLPIEEMARRGGDTLRFGPMKPMGLVDPRTGRRPYAVVQLRQENLRAGSYNLVGFQNHLKFAEQARILRLIPGLEQAEFFRFGQIHRNTYINAPALLTPSLQLRARPSIFFAGQISGVEGYVESIATGLIAGRNAAAIAELGGADALFRAQPPGPALVRNGASNPLPASAFPLPTLPRQTALGSLCHYISEADARNYQPANIAFDLLPPLEEETARRLRHDKKARHAEICRRALQSLEEHLHAHV
jgi:methylenetetrahydrofolate--tRNA-(uracil-5-)-methyltransferase